MPVIADRKALPPAPGPGSDGVPDIGLPPELKEECVASRWTKRCAFEFLRYDSMPLSSLLLPRPEPHILESDGEGVTSQEPAAGARPGRTHRPRRIGRGEDPAAAIYAAAAQKPTLLDDVKSAKTVASRAQRAAARWCPIARRVPQGSVLEGQGDGIRQENKLWDVILDRLAGLKADALTRSLARFRRRRRGPVHAAGPGASVTPACRSSPWARPASTCVSRGARPLASPSSRRCSSTPPATPTSRKRSGTARDVETVDIAAYLHVRTVVCLDSNTQHYVVRARAQHRRRGAQARLPPARERAPGGEQTSPM